MIAGSSLFFPMIHVKYVVSLSLWPRTIKILISNWPRTRKFSQFFKNTGKEDLFLPWLRVGHALRPMFMLWLTGEFMRKIYAASWKLYTLTVEADRVLCQLVMFLTVFVSTGCTKWKYICKQKRQTPGGRLKVKRN